MFSYQVNQIRNLYGRWWSGKMSLQTMLDFSSVLKEEDQQYLVKYNLKTLRRYRALSLVNFFYGKTDNNKIIIKVPNEGCSDHIKTAYEPKNGDLRDDHYDEHGIRFCVSDGEIRPNNKAMRIWKRTK
jgi:hypothetical protein